MITRYFSLGLAILTIACFFIPTQAHSGERIIEISTPTIIFSADSSRVHYLLNPPLDLPDTNIIDFVWLSLWVQPLTEDTITYSSIRVFPISSSWGEENASWNFPWNSPGGDIDELFEADYAVSIPGEQLVEIDLTEMYRSWADGHLPYFGFLLNVSETSLAGVQFLSNPDNGNFAKLTIKFSELAD